MYVCLCHAVTESNIHHAVLRGACSLRDLRNELKVATQCGRCATCAKTCLNRALAASVATSGVVHGILPPTTLVHPCTAEDQATARTAEGRTMQEHTAALPRIAA